jgi:hypothetical protein
MAERCHLYVQHRLMSRRALCRRGGVDPLCTRKLSEVSCKFCLRMLTEAERKQIEAERQAAAEEGAGG